MHATKYVVYAEIGHQDGEECKQHVEMIVFPFGRICNPAVLSICIFNARKNETFRSIQINPLNPYYP